MDEEKIIIQKFIANLKDITPLGNEELREIINICTIKELQIGEYFFNEGMWAKEIAYVFKGYLRKYYLKEGKELTDFFYFENSFTADLPSIIRNVPCVAFNVAMEQTMLVTFSYYEIDKLSAKYPKIDHLLRTNIERTFITFHEKSASFVLQTPKERYQQLISAYPQILQRVTQYHIASYLGITPQHLSRLRGGS